MRLEQVLFSQGFGTRHECRGLIALGRVTFDGVQVDDPDMDVEPEGKRFQVDGKEWSYYEKAIVALNKPAGYECSQKPTHHPSVMSLLPPPLRVRGVQPVGRLDEDTTGLLLLTDDGAVLHMLTHPKKHVAKTYVAELKHPAKEELVAKLLAGVELVDDRECVRATHCRIVSEHAIEMTITSGKYHQVKRMIAAAGNRVEKLHRQSVGKLSLPEDLPVGQWKFVTLQEIK